MKASAWWLGPCSTLTLTATVSGPPVTLASEDGLSGVFSAVRGQADVCALPGGSDLPGTVVRFEATGSATAREDFPLPDLGESLTAGVESLPAAGSQVGPGDRIKLHAIAMVMPPAQGIEVLYVDDGNDLIESVGNVSGTEEPISCDLGRYFAQLVSEYRVPADAPPIIEICANAKGFDGTQSRDCIEFYTGEVWKGTLEVSGTFAGTVTCTSTWDGSVTFAIGEDGAITGGGTVSNPGVYRCPVPTEQPAPSAASFTVAGRAGESDLQIEFGGTQVAFGQEGFGLPPGRIRIPRSGSQASGSDSLTHAAGGATATYRHVWTLECASCGEPDG